MGRATTGATGGFSGVGAGAVGGGTSGRPSAQSAMTSAAADAMASQLSASNRRSARVNPTWKSKLACHRPSVGPLTLTIATTGAGVAPARARLFSTSASTRAAVGHSGGAFRYYHRRLRLSRRQARAAERHHRGQQRHVRRRDGGLAHGGVNITQVVIVRRAAVDAGEADDPSSPPTCSPRSRPWTPPASTTTTRHWSRCGRSRPPVEMPAAEGAGPRRRGVHAGTADRSDAPATGEDSRAGRRVQGHESIDRHGRSPSRTSRRGGAGAHRRVRGGRSRRRTRHHDRGAAPGTAAGATSVSALGPPHDAARTGRAPPHPRPRPDGGRPQPSPRPAPTREPPVPVVPPAPAGHVAGLCSSSPSSLLTLLAGDAGWWFAVGRYTSTPGVINLGVAAADRQGRGGRPELEVSRAARSPRPSRPDRSSAPTQAPADRIVEGGTDRRGRLQGAGALRRPPARRPPSSPRSRSSSARRTWSSAT